MSDINKTDLYEKIKSFQLKTFSQKPSIEEMIQEVRMMNFKVRPVYGNIAKLDFKNGAFIDALWSLGKLDEFFRDEVVGIEDEEREIFFKIIEEMRASFQKQLNRTQISDKTPKGDPTFFEIEIFKDHVSQVN